MDAELHNSADPEVKQEQAMFSAADDKEKEEKEGKNKQDKAPESDNKSEGKKKADTDGDDDNDDKEKDKKKYSLNDIPEYVELSEKYSAIVEEKGRLESTIQQLNTEIEGLRQFKLEADRVNKKSKIDEFFMLSDEDKADVIENIDKYSLDEIEAKLSVICFRNKVSFADPTQGTEEEKKLTPTTFSLQGLEEDNSVPEWVKMVRLVQASED